ncbi:MAG: hypothetical protein WD406_08085 [Pseudohongiellaceae bacterium]
MFIKRVCRQLDHFKVRYAVAGGHAVALHGAVRGTVDIDFVLNWTEENLCNAEKALRQLGLVSRLPLTATEVFANREHYIRDRHLIAWNFYNPRQQEEQVDLLISFDLTGQRVEKVKLADCEIPVLGLDELIAMKTASSRPQDLLDIEALEKLRK